MTGMKCPMCEHDQFEKGKVQGHYDVKSKPDNSNILAKVTVFGGRATRAKRCKACGFIALFAD